MTDRPPVSVVVPVYNCAAYLPRCIDSILQQTLPGIEIVLVNDGSTDESLKICTDYANSHDNIVLIDQPNFGAEAARKIGIAASSGEYISFVDSDDWIAPWMYEKLVKTSEFTNSDIVQCGYIVSCSDVESPLKTPTPGCETPHVFSSREALLQLFGVSFPCTFNFLLWNKIYRRELFNNLSFPFGHKAQNDVALIPRVFYQAYTISVIPTPLYFYFKRSDATNMSITDTLDASLYKKIQSHIEAFNDVSNYFKTVDHDLYLASLKNTVAWSLSALIRRNISPECRSLAKNVLKSAEIRGNPYIPFKKMVAGLLVQLGLWR